MATMLHDDDIDDVSDYAPRWGAMLDVLNDIEGAVRETRDVVLVSRPFQLSYLGIALAVCGGTLLARWLGQ